MKRRPVRSRFTVWLIFARLAWGRSSSPLHWHHNFMKIFPPPRITYFKDVLKNYFIWN